MLFYVVERLTIYLEQFPAQTIGQPQIAVLDEQIHRQARIIAEALGETQHQFAHIRAFYPQRPQVCNHPTQFFAFLLNRFLQSFQLLTCLLRGPRELVAQDVELDIEAEQGLENAVVEVARDAAALGFDGAGAQVAHQEDVLQRRPYVPDNLLEPAQITGGEFSVRFLRVNQQDAARGASASFNRDREHGAHAELFASGIGRGVQLAVWLAAAAVPAKAVPGTVSVAILPT